LATPLTPIDLNKIELFTVTYLSHRLKLDVPKFHREWYAAYADRSIQYLCIEAMRGGAKTTVMENCALFEICEGVDDNITLVSRAGGTTGTATLIMGHIKDELENNILLINDYGLQRGKYWGEDRLQIKRGDGKTVNFWSMGKRSSIRGKRGTVIIDDPQNRDDAQSETVLVRDEEWFLTDVVPVAIQDQRLIFIGTPISPLSLLSKVKALPGWAVKSFPIEDPPHSGKSVWPEQYPDKDLAQRKAMMGIDLYAAEYLCEPRVSGNPVFRPEWFPSYDPTSVVFSKVKKDGLFVVLGMDCAESKSDQADYTALVTIGVTYGEKPDAYILDVRRNHWSTKEGAEQAMLVFDEHKQHKTVVESRVKEENGGDAMVQEIRERERIYSKYINMYPVRPVRDKVTRANQVQSICQEGRVFFDRHDSEQQALLSELTMFTGSQNYHDDLVDAFVMAMSEVRQRERAGAAKSVASGIGGEW